MFSIVKNNKNKLNNKRRVKESAVSLISLIVTIIVLLILASIAIKISSGDAGVIKKAKKGASIYENTSEDESETMDDYARKIKKFVKAPRAENIEFKADITEWTTNDVTVTATSDDPDCEIELKSEDSDWAVRKDNKITVSRNQQINARLKNIMDKYSEDVATYNVTNIDRLAPTNTAPTATATTNCITVTNKQTDNESGIASIQYQIKKNGTSTWGSLQSGATFGGLTQNTKYDVRTHAVDKAGNASDSAVTTVTTDTIPTPVRDSNLTFTPTPSAWTNGNVSVKVATTVTGYTLQTSTDGKSWGTTNPLTYSANGTAYARLWDGTNASSAATLNVTNIDKLAPNNTAPTVTATGNKIVVTNRQTDATATSSYGNSGIKSSETRYAIKKSSSATWGAWQTSNSFTGLETGTSYNIKTKVTDNAGNSSESNVSTVTTLTGTLNKIDLTKENSNNYITWASDKKSLKLNDGNVYAGTIDSSAAYEAGSNSMPHRTGENYTYDGKVDNQYYHIHFPTGWYNTWDGASWAPEVRIPISQAPNTQIWKDAYNAGKGSIQTALFGGTTQTVSINCSTSTNASVYVHNGNDPLWTEYNANYSGKSDNIYLLKDPSGNSAIANTITISYNCGGNEAYGQEYRYSQKIYLKDATGKVIDSISNGNGSRTWNLFTYSIGGDYVYLEYQLTAYVRYTKSNPDGQARAYSSMTTPSVIYLYGK